MKDTNRTKKRRKVKLSTKLLLGLVLHALSNMIIISLVIGFYYFSVEVTEASQNAFALTRTGSHRVDGDRVRDYLQVVGTDGDGNAIYFTDDYYFEVLDYMRAVQRENDLVKYYYICLPGGEGVIYIWDATETEEGYSAQGSTESVLPAMAESMELAFSREPQEKISAVADPRWGNLISAYSPIFDSTGEPVALIGVDLTLEGLMKRFMVYLFLILATVLIVTVISILILYRVIKKFVIKPVEKLNQATKNIVGELKGETRFDPEIHSGDEMEELADSFRKMDDDLRTYIGQLTSVTTEKERIHAELNIAKGIQADLLPNDFPAFPERNDFDIFAGLYPSEQIGGDFYDFFLIDDDHLVMTVGDVAGEGVPAALYTVVVGTLIKSRAMQGFTPAEVLQNVSDQMLGYNMDMFSFIWFAVLELSTGKGIAVNAGHEHPILRRAGGRFELQKYRHFPPVGAVEGIRFRDHGFQLHPGDSLFIYSDGVKDAANGSGESFGKQRLLDVLNREPDATPSVLLQTVKQALERFTGEERQKDDFTMLSLKYYGPNTEKRSDLILGS